jgi:hypothetical protein
MEFEGNDLLLIVANQGAPLQAMDGYGNLERVFENPHSALAFIAVGGYVGIGNRKHIRYIRPKDPEQHRVPWASLGEIAVEILDQTRRRLPEVFGLKRWVATDQKRTLECRSLGAASPRLYVKRNPQLPWSEANAKPIY